MIRQAMKTLFFLNRAHTSSHWLRFLCLTLVFSIRLANSFPPVASAGVSAFILGLDAGVDKSVDQVNDQIYAQITSATSTTLPCTRL